ncbi:MAG: polyprenyl synthetase family protein [candidate division NC10 bacterium]|nr:polyprenyl synthetase family protein [candidate division NC10 bacterium]
MFDLATYLEKRRRLVEEALNRYLPPETERPSLLHKAMRYSVECGGKRLRPLLCLASAEAVGGAMESAMIPAVALEYLHTYTLIHDDLPAMDNDDLRRGKPTSHKMFGEANAILAGDALLTLAFEVLSGMVAPPPYPPNQLILELAQAAGSRGVAGGQFEDLASEDRVPHPEQVDYIHAHKTAILIRAACRLGAIAGAAPPGELEALSLYGERAGLAFQIADDILNATSSLEELGKAVGSDAARQKMTYVALYGIERAQEKAEALVREAMAVLAEWGPRSEPLAALARFMVHRSR